MSERSASPLAGERFNACEYLLDRRVAAGDGDRTALSGVAGELTYAQLLRLVCRCAVVLTRLGLQPEQRLMLYVADSPEFVALYLAAMRIGAIPVPVSTMLRSDGLAELLHDSRAKLLAVSPQFRALAEQAVVGAGELAGVLVTSPVVGAAREAATGDAVRAVAAGDGRPGWFDLADLLAAAGSDGSDGTVGSAGSDGSAGADGSVGADGAESECYPTTEDSPAFWLYTSGTTGKSKAAMHRHGSVRVVCETYASQVLGIRSTDRCLSAAKAFFAYGLGNTVLFPLAVGACAILEPAPSRPDLLAERAGQFRASLFFAGPSFFAAMLHAGLPPDALAGVRLAASAGEALPAALYHRWTAHFGVDIIDGIGMTELLHIFLSNRPGDVRPGTTGVAVPGYRLRIVDEAGLEVPAGMPGTLLVSGDSAATGYWSRYAASRQVFQGEWLRTGDTYRQDADGSYQCLGRTGDMLKAGGIWVAPAEVEARLLAHPAVAQAIVVAGADHDGLDKPVAFVQLEAGAVATEAELIEFCRTGLPSFKRPRRVVFVEAYPSTATGKIRRVALRELATELFTGAPG